MAQDFKPGQLVMIKSPLSKHLRQRGFTPSLPRLGMVVTATFTGLGRHKESTNRVNIYGYDVLMSDTCKIEKVRVSFMETIVPEGEK